MKGSEKNKKFIKGIIKLWMISIVVLFAMNFLSSKIESENMSGVLSDTSGVIFMFGVCGLPIILICFSIVTFAGKLIDKIPGKEK